MPASAGPPDDVPDADDDATTTLNEDTPTDEDARAADEEVAIDDERAALADDDLGALLGPTTEDARVRELAVEAGVLAAEEGAAVALDGRGEPELTAGRPADEAGGVAPGVQTEPPQISPAGQSSSVVHVERHWPPTQTWPAAQT